MATIDFAPLYRSTVGFDRLAPMLESAMRKEHAAAYPPYDIEVIDENRYAITIAVAGFERSELDIHVEKGVLTVRGRKEAAPTDRRYLHQGIARRAFERKFNLADHVEVTDASLRNGLLMISLVREIPEAMKPKTIPINDAEAALEHSEGQAE